MAPVHANKNACDANHREPWSFDLPAMVLLNLHATQPSDEIPAWAQMWLDGVPGDPIGADCILHSCKRGDQ